MQIIKMTILFSIISQLSVYAQIDTNDLLNKKQFLNELNTYHIDTTDIANLYDNKDRQVFFYKTLDEIYMDDSLSDKQCFYIVLFSFPEFSKLIPEYNELKKEVLSKYPKSFQQKINKFTIKRETYENLMIMNEGNILDEQVLKLDEKYKVEEIVEDTLISKLDSSKTPPVLMNENNTLEPSIEKVENELKKEEQKILKAKKLKEEEMRRMEKEEKKQKEGIDD